MFRSRSRLSAVATSRPERKTLPVDLQFTLQVRKPDSSPAMLQSLREQFIVWSNRYALEDVVSGVFQ